MPELALQFPVKGVTEIAPHGSVPPGTTPAALNVRPFDVTEKRVRGGRRPGSEKVIDQQVNGSLAVQLLEGFVDVAALIDAGSVGAKFTDPASGFAGSTGGAVFSPDGTMVAIWAGSGDGLQLYSFNLTTGYGSQIDEITESAINTAFGLTGAAVQMVSWNPTGTYLALAVGTSGQVGGLGAYPVNSSTGFGTLVTPSTAPVEQVRACVWSNDGIAIVYTGLKTSAHVVKAYAWSGSAFGSVLSGPSSQIQGSPQATSLAISPDDDFVVIGHGISPFLDAYPFNTSTGFGTRYGDPTALSVALADSPIDIRNGGDAVAMADGTKLVVYAFSSVSGWSTKNTQTLAGGVSGRGVAFTDTGDFIGVGISGTPRDMQVYPWTGSFGTALSSPSTVPSAGTGYWVDWYPASPNTDQVVIFYYSGTSVGAYTYRFKAATTRPEPRTFRLVSVAGGTVAVSDDGFTFWTDASGGGSALHSTNPIRGTTAFQKFYFADGRSAIKYLDFADDTVKSWYDAITAGSPPLAASGSSFAISAVNTGTPSFSTLTDLSALAAGSLIEISGSTANDGIYKVVSATGTSPTVITTVEGISDATVDGTIGEADIGPRICVTYRGRVVLAGLDTDPQNWFMSAAGNPNDFNYGSTLATGAVAGNNSNAGKVGDIITALAPYSDDLMVIGGANSIWLLSGDPKYSGQLDTVSEGLGIVGQEAWDWDVFGRLYFMSATGLYRMVPGSSLPEMVSRGFLDKTFADIDYSTKRVHLKYDARRKGLHICISNLTEPSTAPTHYWWDERTEGFWPEQYTTEFGPTAIGKIAADTPSNSAVIFGGFDSYVRKLSDSATRDDTTTISSYVDFGPMLFGDGSLRAVLSDVEIVLGVGSGTVTLQCFAESSPEGVIDSTTVRYARTLTAGRNRPSRQRVADGALRLRLTHAVVSETWSFESGHATLRSGGRLIGGRV